MNDNATSAAEGELPAFVRGPRPAQAGQRRTVAPTPDVSRADNAVSRPNAILAIAILVVIALAAIPFGSNRPAFWAIWGSVLGGLGIVYGAVLAGSGARPRFALAGVGPEAVLFLVLILGMAGQALPLGGLVPLTVVTQSGETIALRSASLDPGSTLTTGMQFVSFGVLFLLTLQVAANHQRARQLLLALFFVIAGFAAFGLASLTMFQDTLLGGEKIAYQGFVTGTFINRNSFATFLASGAVIGLSLLFDSGTNGQRTLSARVATRTTIGLALLLILAALFGTGSRMGVFSAIAGLLVTAVLNASRMNTKVSRLVLAAVLGLLVVGGLLGVTGSGLLERLVLTQGVDAGRAEVHAMTLSAILARPLIGYGAGSFASSFPLFLEPSAIGATVWEYPHSTYLTLWYELGVVLGSIPLVIIAGLALRASSGLGGTRTRLLASAALGTVTVFACHSLMDFSAEIEANAFLLTFVLALGVAAGRPTGSGGRAA